MIYAGRGGGIRTPDPLLPKQMRYQAALRPDSDLIVTRMGFPLEWLRRLSPSKRIRCLCRWRRRPHSAELLPKGSNDKSSAPQFMRFAAGREAVNPAVRETGYSRLQPRSSYAF